jgi:hypothetical protein
MTTWLSILSILVAVVAVILSWMAYRRSEDRAHRAERSAAYQRASRLCLDLHAFVGIVDPNAALRGEHSSMGGPQLTIRNASEVVFAEVAVSEENTQGGPHGAIGYYTDIQPGDTKHVALPAGFENIQVTFRDSEGTGWRRRWVGIDFELEWLL